MAAQRPFDHLKVGFYQTMDIQKCVFPARQQTQRLAWIQNPELYQQTAVRFPAWRVAISEEQNQIFLDIKGHVSTSQDLSLPRQLLGRCQSMRMFDLMAFSTAERALAKTRFVHRFLIASSTLWFPKFHAVVSPAQPRAVHNGFGEQGDSWAMTLVD